MLLANEVATIAPFTSSGFCPKDIAIGLQLAASKYPNHRTRPLPQQGGCSFTLSAVSTSKRHDDDEDDDERVVIIQFRLQRFALSAAVAYESRRIYGSLVPAPLWFENVVASHGAQLQVCAMTSIPGCRFGDLQPRERHLSDGDVEKLKSFMDGMARSFAIGLNAAKAMERKEMDGKIGPSLMARLRKLGGELPKEWMRSEAGLAADAVESGVLDVLPVVLNHGDLLPSNIMVDGDSWELAGIVDWAEAEYLPFGMSLYGIEHLLGFQDDNADRTSRNQFTFYDQAGELRDRFWMMILRSAPELAELHIQTAVLLSRTIGILLWHGFAWDDGKIDRVVNELDDQQEMAYLEAFLRTTTDQEKPKL